MSKEIVVRDLTVQDRKDLTGIILKASEELKDDAIKNLISSDKKPSKKQDETSEDEMGVTVVNIAFSFLGRVRVFVDEDITKFMANLIDVTPEEFNKLPFNTEIEIMSQLKEKPEAAAFFTQALALAKVITVFDKPLKMLKTKYGSIFSLLEDFIPSATEK